MDLQRRRRSSNVFQGKHGFITPRDLFRWADRKPLTYEELAEAHRALERAYLRPSYRLREKIVQLLEGSRPGRVVMAGYRRLRGRSSSSA